MNALSRDSQHPPFRIANYSYCNPIGTDTPVITAANEALTQTAHDQANPLADTP
jgi:hypothetical protein